MIRFIFYSASLCFLASCNNTNHGNVTTNENRATVLKLFENFNNHDWSAMANCYAPDAEFLDPSYGKEYVKQSHQQLIEKYAGIERVIPDIREDIKWIYIAGENIIVEFTSSGTLPGSTKWKLPICSVFSFKSGKIVRDATYYDEEK